jgi:hypothetical protein
MTTEEFDRLKKLLKDNYDQLMAQLVAASDPTLVSTSETGGNSWRVPAHAHVKGETCQVCIPVKLETAAGEFVCSTAVPATKVLRGFQPVPPSVILLRETIFAHDGAGPGRDREIYIEATCVRLPTFGELS